MNKKDKIKKNLGILKLNTVKEMLDEVLINAEKEKKSYQNVIHDILEIEVKAKNKRARKRRFKQSKLNPNKTIEAFNFNFQESINEKEINQLLDFEWLEQAFNLIFLGPPGVGKTHLANGIGLKAVNKGYKVKFIDMDQLIKVLKTNEVVKKSRLELKKIKKADLLIIDEIGYLPITKDEANKFFKLITALYEQTSIIITSNKGFGKWAEIMGDQVITTAILDRIMHHSEIFNLKGKSYRLECKDNIIKGRENDNDIA
ncbi:MAG: IS21-like element helper ATPase IstB [Thermotogota bacterium]